MRSPILLLFAALPLLAAPQNERLLGVVAVARDGKVLVAHVLKKSPAAKAGLKAGDELIAIAGAKIARPADVGAAVKAEKLEVRFRRDGREQAVTVKTIERKRYRGDFLKPTPRGKTGFDAPDWHVYAWSGLKEGQEPPTRQNTKGKVVVFHCFQSW